MNNDWPTVVVELRSHTDLRGSDTLNNRLSFDRAQSCVDYLVEKGVEESRLSTKGFGEDNPKASNDTRNGRITNRRVEFKVVE